MNFAAMDQRQLRLGQVIFGDVGNFIGDIAHDNDAQFWFAGDRVGYNKLNAEMDDYRQTLSTRHPCLSGRR